MSVIVERSNHALLNTSLPFMVVEKYSNCILETQTRKPFPVRKGNTRRDRKNTRGCMHCLTNARLKHACAILLDVSADGKYERKTHENFLSLWEYLAEDDRERVLRFYDEHAE